MRYLTTSLKNDLKKKMVLLAGPRQVGKSTLASGLMDSNSVYLNWDIKKDRRIILQQSWPKDASLVILDEIHKHRKWKNQLKGICDEFRNSPPILVTGSAKLDTFRKSGDALTGRTFLYHLHPIDVVEARTFLPNLTVQQCLDRLLQTGGFPEAFLNPDDAERLRNDRLEIVLEEDLRDLSKSNSIKTIELMLELLRERVGGPLNFSNLAGDLDVSAPTVKNWVELFEKLYLIFRITPYSTSGLKRSLKKESKVYFYDCASALGSGSANFASRLENMVATTLVKFCDYQRDRFGKRLDIHYFRDREGREVDFVVTLNRKPYWCIEVKTSDETLSKNLLYFHERAKPVNSYQLVYKLDRKREIRGIQIVSLTDWLDQLDYSKILS